MKLKIILIFLLCMVLTGCFNYTGIDRLTMVAGFSIDNKKDTFILNFEIIDTIKSNPTEGIKTKVIECEGRTITETITNCKKLLSSRLYFGNTQIVIINKDIAKKGIHDIVLLLLNEHEFRESLKVVVSDEKKAKDIIMADKTNNAILSYQINDIIYEDQSITLSTALIPVYKIFSQVISKDKAFVLPIFKLKKNNDDKKVASSNGLDLFKGNKLVGHINEQNSKAYLFVTDQVRGGDITIKLKEDKKVSLQVLKSSTRNEFELKNDKLKVKQKINMNILLRDYSMSDREKDEEEFEKVKKEIVKKMEKEITKYVYELLNTYKIDVFNFKENIYKTDQKLYKKIKNKKIDFFSDIEYDLKINCLFEDRGFLGG